MANETITAKRVIRVYLAGGFYSNWRQKVQEYVERLETSSPYKFEFYDPATDTEQTSAWRFIRDDLGAIDRSDLVIAYYNGKHPSHGMAAEIGYANALRKPVFYVDESHSPDMFLVGCSKRFFSQLEHLLTWLYIRIAEEKPVI